jgi:hypothetical protein
VGFAGATGAVEANISIVAVIDSELKFVVSVGVNVAFTEVFPVVKTVLVVTEAPPETFVYAKVPGTVEDPNVAVAFNCEDEMLVPGDMGVAGDHESVGVALVILAVVVG